MANDILDEVIEEWDDGLEGRQKLDLKKIVAFELDNELYGAGIDDVAEIMKIVPIMPLPNVPEFILGLINLRGTIIPVIDLRIRFGLNRKAMDQGSRIIVMKHGNLVVGVVVDRLWELLRLPLDAFQPPPPDVAKIDAEYFKEVSLVNERMLIVLDIKKLLAETARKQ